LVFWKNTNSKNTNIKILEPENNGVYTGTANAIYQKLDYLRKQPADKILIMPSDHAYKMDYRKMLAFHEKSKADVTVGVIPVPIEEAHRFGTLTWVIMALSPNMSKNPMFPAATSFPWYLHF